MLTTGSDTWDLIDHRGPLTNGDLQCYTRAEANSLPWSGRGMPTQAKVSQLVLMKGAAICRDPGRSEPGFVTVGGRPESLPLDWCRDANVILFQSI